MSSSALPTDAPSTNNPNAAKSAKAYSCVRCFERKVKCDKQNPCAACVRSNVSCVFRVPAAPRRRKKRTQEEILNARLKRYETLLKANGISLDAASPDEETNTNEGDADAEAFQSLEISDTPAGSRKGSRWDGEADEVGKLYTDRGKSTFLENNLFSGLAEELDRSQGVLPDSSEEDEQADIPLNDPFRTDLVLGFTPTMPPTHMLHPSPDHIFELWQLFLHNVNPLVKIVHQPTVQSVLFEAAFNLENVNKSFEPLMFGIYSTTINSLTEVQCEKLFGEGKATLFARYLHGMRQTLMQARFLGTSELSVLQGFVLYIFATRNFYRPRTTWVIAGVASRIAQGMGLHRDGSTLGLPIFEAEIRRRLWWQICILDARSAELTGSKKVTDLWPWEVRCPMNVNDDELYPGMTEVPPVHSRPTEMVSCLLRHELGTFRQTAPDGSVQGMWWTTMPSMSIEQADKLVDEFEKRLEENFFKYLDPSIPAHFHCSLVGRVSISVLRFMAHHPRRWSGDRTDLSKLPPTERDFLYGLSLKILECDCLCYSSPITERFLWHIRNYFQWQAFIFVLTDLRTRTEGDAAARGWQVVGEVFEHHPEFLTRRSERPLYIAAGNLCLKAWNARERTMARQTPHMMPMDAPYYILKLRGHSSRDKTRQQNSGAEARAQGGLFGLPKAKDGPLLPIGADWGSKPRSQLEDFETTASVDSTLLSDTPMDDIGPMDWSQWDYLLQDFEFPI